MSAIDTTRNIERLSLEILRPFIRQQSFEGQYVVTAKGRLSRELQLTVGDVLYNKDEETILSIEIKAEQENKFGNFFLETWSNRQLFNPGWMFKVNCDWLFYHFLMSDELYAINYAKLRKWAFQDCRIYAFPERSQSKYEQKNDTWGRCVPIAVLQKEIGLRDPFRPEAFLKTEEAA